MRLKQLWPLGAAGLVAVVAARCSKPGGGGGTPPIPHCEADISAYLKEGSGARVAVATEADLFTGDTATGRVGDYLLSNDKIRVLIEGPNREIGAIPYGGTIVDADIVRPGERGRDHFGEIGSVFQLGRTVNVERLEVLRDGSGGGAAVLAATGRDALLDYIDVAGVAKLNGLTLPLPDAARDMSLRITTYYVLNPGESAVHMVQSFCNDGRDYLVFPAGDIVDSGGDLEAFTGSGGFKKGGDDITNALANGLPERLAAWISKDVAYGYVPPTDMNQMVTLSGVSVSLLGAKSLGDFLNPDAEPEGAIVLTGGEHKVISRDFVVAKDISGVYDYFYASRNASIGRLEGTVKDAKGALQANVRVVALQNGKTVSLFTTDADGRFSGTVPTGSITVQADDNATRTDEVTVDIAAGGVKDVPLSLPAAAKLAVHVRDASGPAIPGKVTLMCLGNCPISRTDDVALRFRDVLDDKLPQTSEGQVFDIRYLDPSGDLELAVPAGSYKVYVSRGSEYSLFSEEVTLSVGESKSVEAKLSHVVDTTGWMSGDFHVHAAPSSDSVVPNLERLRNFMAEGVDVLVATDHDVITDFAPLIAQIPRASEFLRSIVGQELSTNTYGHYNAFPIVRDPNMRNGGAIDWAGGKGASMTPGDIFKALDSFPGEQVVQINHGLSSTGALVSMGLDTRTLWTRRNPLDFRIRPVEADLQTGDTRLFDPSFTAMEIYNALGTGQFKKLVNAWMSLLSRGLRKTATAVSDTHVRHGEAGWPRTFVKTDTDSPAQLDPAAFAHAVNQGRAFGTNGPFVHVTAKTANGTPVSMGDTLVSNGEKVTVNIELRMPEWMNVDEVRVYANTPGTETDASGRGPSELPEPQAVPALSSTVKDGARTLTASAELTLSKDAWIVVIAQGGTDLFPVVGKGGTFPLAFTNPIYVDVDGQGWTPPVDLAAERARVGRLEGTSSQALRKPVSEGELRHILANECEH